MNYRYLLFSLLQKHYFLLSYYNFGLNNYQENVKKLKQEVAQQFVIGVYYFHLCQKPLLFVIILA